MSEELRLGSARFVFYAFTALVLGAGALHLIDRRSAEAAREALATRVCQGDLPAHLLSALAVIDSCDNRVTSDAPELFAQWVGGGSELRARVMYVRSNGIQEQLWKSPELQRPWGVSLEELGKRARARNCVAVHEGTSLRAYRPLSTAGGTRVLLMVEQTRR